MSSRISQCMLSVSGPFLREVIGLPRAERCACSTILLRSSRLPRRLLPRKAACTVFASTWLASSSASSFLWMVLSLRFMFGVGSVASTLMFRFRLSGPGDIRRLSWFGDIGDIRRPGRCADGGRRSSESGGGTESVTLVRVDPKRAPRGGRAGAVSGGRTGDGCGGSDSARDAGDDPSLRTEPFDERRRRWPIATPISPSKRAGDRCDGSDCASAAALRLPDGGPVCRRGTAALPSAVASRTST